MRTQVAVVAVSAVLALVGVSCVAMQLKAPDHADIAKMDNDKLSEMFWRYTDVPPEQIDAASRHQARARMFDEMTRRGLLPDFSRTEWFLVREQQLGTGMSRIALIYSWGRPDRAEQAQTTSGVEIEHFIYSRADRGADYVLIQEGAVKSWEIND